MATLSDGSFVGWFVFLTLCLHYTTGEASPDLAAPARRPSRW